MSIERFIGFVDGTSCHTCNLDSAAWVMYAPTGQLVTSKGACLGPTTNNMAEYNTIIEILRDVSLHEITCLEVRLES